MEALVRTASWSFIPPIVSHDCMAAGRLVIKISKMLLPLVGKSTICIRPLLLRKSRNVLLNTKKCCQVYLQQRR